MSNKANKKKTLFFIGVAVMALGALTTAGALHAKTHPEAYVMQMNDATFSNNAMAVTAGYAAPMMPFNKSLNKLNF